MKKKILYIEDEAYLARIVKDTLELKGYEVQHKKDGSRMLATVNSFNPDICLLDVMLPNVDGYTLSNLIRNAYPRLPIILITAKTQTDDLIKGFSVGCTDYIKKPFSMEELMVRIENQLKLVQSETPLLDTLPEEVELKQYRFYPGRFELHTGNDIIKLSHRESQVLAMLCVHKNKMIERKSLLHTIWGDDSFFNSRNLDVYIRKLRGYLSHASGIEIVTLKGIGYHFVVA